MGTSFPDVIDYFAMGVLVFIALLAVTRLFPPPDRAQWVGALSIIGGANKPSLNAPKELIVPSRLSAHATVIHIVGDLFAHLCQFAEFLFGDSVVGLCS